MSLQEDLAGAYGRNLAMLKKEVEGLSHADTVLQLPFGANCMNWVLGHIAASRDNVLKLLGEQPLMTPEQAKRYGYGSAPVCADGPDLIKLDDVMKVMERSQAEIEAGLKRATAEDLQKQVQAYGGMTSLGNRIMGLYGHECQHIGQVDMLRELAKK